MTTPPNDAENAAPTDPGVAPGGRWFDGRSTRAQGVQVRLDAEALHLEPALAPGGPELQRRIPRSQLGVPEAFDPDAPLPLALPDGSTLWLEGEASAAVRRSLVAASTPRWGAIRAVRSWPAALAALLLLVALMVWFDRQGVGLAATAVLNVLPTSVDRRLGDAVAAEVRARWVLDRTEHEARRDRIASRFLAAAAETDPDWAPHLELHFVRERRDRQDSVGEPGFNAFALPNGSIWVFDGLAEKLSDDELLAVLGHELGHVRHRHGMRNVVRSLGLVAVAGAVFGDLSTLAASVVGSIQFARHSREAEREADAYALRFMQAAGVPPETMLAVWLKFGAEMQRLGAAEPPGWMSTHPGLDERLEAARRAASAPR